jgi:predicted alpha/beta hydrolase
MLPGTWGVRREGADYNKASATPDGRAPRVWSTERGAQRLLEEHLPQISAQQRVIAPRDAGLKRIGHFGFFRRSAAQTLWPQAARWLES